jgi:dTMP kinase
VTDRGLYVVLEGIDGTGKTELAARLVPLLLARGHSVSSFHEPADRFLHAQFSRLVRTDSFSAALCLTVDRNLQRPNVERALDVGDVVVQDRSFYSTLAYQYPGLSNELYHELERIERTLALEPDVVLYLDAPIELAMARVEGKGLRSAYEDEPYLSKVKWKFEQMFQPPKWVRIDARGTPEQTLEQGSNALFASGL